MNSNLFQTILTTAITIAGFATTILLSLGCHDVAGAINCVGSNAPAWLAPYLIIATSVLGALKLVIGFATGKLVKPTVAVTNSGAPGTVLPSQVR